ncbi:UPF0280 family protein [Yoonia sp. 2307UL14-13]|uniref:UPF0280 family protein n=1 Tax=Yoonia sp. 2307UL14-13 TaxID=3126506 RepID=UPI0030A7ABA6
MTAPQHALLPDCRLHLHHGPIDLIIGVEGSKRNACYRAACERFATVLQGLVAELSDLRQPLQNTRFSDPIARRMAQAVAPHGGVFVTPMAAVAGAVADEVLAAMITDHVPPKAYVNNGGDIALHLSGQRSFNARSPTADITITAEESARGIATSGWRGRSHSLGIADAVTVLARTAATADVAATLIANAVDVPGHPAVSRQPASALSPDSDLGERLVTTDVGPLPAADIAKALSGGAKVAQNMMNRGHILQAILSLQGQTNEVPLDL